MLNTRVLANIYASYILLPVLFFVHFLALHCDTKVCIRSTHYFFSPTYILALRCHTKVRMRIMRHFNADPADWQLVFTRSATGALKMVGETFPWSSDSMFR
jgi:hypothetical protein